jgi:transcriptional regulator with XRE-family HTH domain
VDPVSPINGDVDTAAQMRHLGAKIRRERKAKNFSLEQLAQLAGVSTGLISQVERGKGNPSFNALAQVAHALGIPVARLFNTASERNPVVRAQERRRLDFHHSLESDAQHHLLTPRLDQLIEAVFVTAPPGYDTSDSPFAHVGEEFGIVLTGRHQVFIDGVCHELGPGDSISYPSTTPHWYRNDGPETVTAIWVITPPTF